jgi:Putative ParB-like nuclease
VRLKNESGVDIEASQLPRTLEAMADDPYRSLAWFVRQKGGFCKSPKEFAEFDWADRFRSKSPTLEIQNLPSDPNDKNATAEQGRAGFHSGETANPTRVERGTHLRPDTYLEWSNSEVNTTRRNDVPTEPWTSVRIEVRRLGGLRSGRLRDGGLSRWERCLRRRNYWRDLRSCGGSMIYPTFTFSLSFYAGRLDTLLCMEIHRSQEKGSNGS